MNLQATKQFDNLREQNIVRLKTASEAGKKTIGFYCTYGPLELAEAAGAYGVTLCGTKEETIADAERDLPRNLCPLIKSSYGFAITDKCPYFYFSELIVGETTCDGKKKMYELMSGFKNIHVMNIPHYQDREDAVVQMVQEINILKSKIEGCTGSKISDEGLLQAIKLLNKERKVLKELFDLNKCKPAPISGCAMMKVAWQSGFHLDRPERIQMLQNLVTEVKESMVEAGVGERSDVPRVLLTGVPTGVGSEKVLELVEECGGNIVVMENCTGYKPVDLLVDEELAAKNPIRALAERYLKIPCSIMSPNPDRLAKVKRLADEFAVDAVIDLTWQACHTYNVEGYRVGRMVKEELGLPHLQIETDYSLSDREQLKIRISALLEMVHN